MLAYTSLGPSRVERQMQCIQTWIDLGLDVIAIQTRDEAPTIKRLFPSVEVQPIIQPKTRWSKQTPYLFHILGYIYEPTILINSDISLHYTQEQFDHYWVNTSPEMICAVRYDVEQDLEPSFNPYGIDVFKLGPEIASEIIDVEFAIAVPGWDYYLPWYTSKKLGLPITTYLHTQVCHKRHTERWCNDDQRYAWHLLHRYTRQEPGRISKWIQHTTGRVNWTLQSSFDHTQEILNGSPTVFDQSGNTVHHLVKSSL